MRKRIFSRKAQIQIGETISVIFVFFILLLIGFVFYAKVLKGNAAIESDEMAQLRSVEIAQRAMFLPELQCSSDVTDSKNCIDKLKIESAKDIMRSKEVEYFDIFGFAKIKIAHIYPSNPEEEIYSRPLSEFKNKFSTNVPVSIYDPVAREYGFGL
ncbi:MAG TPA: hypothetical protein VJI97_04370, partial [Candidatus Nanoarchaeia archaeon]|nr:hypothetical protein [Candidatus Nanoarchaeia archaeon]